MHATMKTRNARLEQCRQADRFRYKIYWILNYEIKDMNYLRFGIILILKSFQKNY